MTGTMTARAKAKAPPATGNAAQIEYWNSAAGERWTRWQKDIDRIFAPFKTATVTALAPQPGERVIDVGCGAGDTSFAIAERVQSQGYILGLDVSKPLLELAQGRAAVTPEYPVEFVAADAATHALPADTFDALFSRFGVMFFADPYAAFAHLRRALKPRARVAFCCWRDRRENGWVRVATEAARRKIAQLPPPPGPDEPGPFSFADEARIRRILSTAGFADVTTERFDPALDFGDDVRHAADFLSEVGPIGSALAEHPHEVRAGVVAELVTLLERERSGGRVVLSAATWIARARNGT